MGLHVHAATTYPDGGPSAGIGGPPGGSWSLGHIRAEETGLLRADKGWGEAPRSTNLPTCHKTS